MLGYDRSTVCHILDGTFSSKASPCVYFSCGRIGDDTRKEAEPVVVRLAPYRLLAFISHSV